MRQEMLVRIGREGRSDLSAFSQEGSMFMLTASSPRQHPGHRHGSMPVFVAHHTAMWVAVGQLVKRRNKACEGFIFCISTAGGNL
eukprot:1156781-Pelagomonas_calceolata.AAC.9